MTSTNVRANETFLVSKNTQTSVPASGTTLVNGANINLADGQVGFFADSPWGSVAQDVAVDTTPTIAEAPFLAIYQGNENSADIATAVANATYPLWARPYERSASIDGRGDVYVTKQAYRDPSHSVWLVGNTSGQSNAINAANETEYLLTINFRGRRAEEMYSQEQASNLPVSVTTPNFTTLGYTTAQSISWIANNIGWEINRNSTQFAINSRFPNNSPAIAFLIDTTGTNGIKLYDATQVGNEVIAAGDTVNVVKTASGVTKSIVLTTSMASSIVAAAVAATGAAITACTWSIAPIELAAVTTTSLGSMLMIVGLDDKVAFVDYIPQRKNRIKVGLTRGFNYSTVRCKEYKQADEGQGDSRTLELLFQATHNQRKYNLSHEEGHPVTKFPSPIVSGQTYTVYNILHSKRTKPDVSNEIITPFREILCVPRYSTGTTANPLITTIDTYLNSWLGSSKVNGLVKAID